MRDHSMPVNGLADSKTNEATEELFVRFLDTRDPFLRHRIVCDNLNLVRPIVRKFKTYVDSVEDLLQVGYIGLIKAVDLFDAGRKVKFSTYATHWIEGEIRHYLRDKAEATRKPRWLTDLTGKINRFIDRYVQEHQKLPGVKEISEGLNIAEEGILEIAKAKSALSMQRIQTDDLENIDVEKVRSLRMDHFKLPIEDVILVEQALENLKKMERKVVYLFFYYDLTQMQIASRLGFSQKKVSRLLNKALVQLKGFFSKTSVVLFVASFLLYLAAGLVRKT
jgi:RNA polymerase sigma-B factor